MSASQPHDALFKYAFSDPDAARGVLQTIVPPEIARALEWESLRVVPGTVVDEALRARHTDLLFHIRLKGTPDQAPRDEAAEGRILVVLEHQSEADPLMPFRMVRYLVRIWDRWLSEGRGATRLPMIVPIVLYHGRRPWNVPLRLSEMIACPEGLGTQLGPYMVDLTLLLEDLGQRDEDELIGGTMSAMARVALLLLKHVRESDDLVGHLVSWAGVFTEVLQMPRGQDAFIAAMRYTISVREDLELDDLRRVVAQAALGARAEDALMTLEQRLIAQGVQQGMQQGMQQGVQQGMQQAAAQMLIRILSKHFGSLPTWAQCRIEEADVATIMTWCDRAYEADALEGVIGCAP